MDELIRLSKKAANEWRNTDAYYQAAVLIDSLCERLEKIENRNPQTNCRGEITMDKDQIYWAALNKWGLIVQLVVALEELSECQKEICKLYRCNANMSHLAEEIADTRICLEQVCLFYGLKDEVAKYKEMKL